MYHGFLDVVYIDIDPHLYVYLLIGDGGNVELTDEYESALGAVREDLVDSLNAWVVKATKSENLRKFFNPDKQAPTVVFFRKK